VKGEKADAADIAKPQEPAQVSTDDKIEIDVPSVPQYEGSTPLNFAAGSAPAPSVPVGPPAPGIPNIPQALIGMSKFSQANPVVESSNELTAQDENIKNIMMSWYYAGYYTGLYDGQQKAYASMQEGK
jgi:hypothetical protein